MNIAIVTLTNQGLQVAQRITGTYVPVPSIFMPKKPEGKTIPQEGVFSEHLFFFTEPLHQFVNKIFKQFDGLVFIMATGIVVRVISPCIRDKYTDPAIVVIDDVGRYVISLLSGHEGGANMLAYRIAALLHTDAVITTGTEAQRDIIIGIGCKKGVAAEAVKESINDALQKLNLRLEHVRLLATVEIKANEPGILKTSDELGLPLRVVSLVEIATCAKEYKKSQFVKEKIGVWAVCEPAALIAGRKTQLILTKQKYKGVTIAIARENFSW